MSIDLYKACTMLNHFDRENIWHNGEREKNKRKHCACMNSESTMISDQGLNRRRIFARAILLAYHVFERQTSMNGRGLSWRKEFHTRLRTDHSLSIRLFERSNRRSLRRTRWQWSICRLAFARWTGIFFTIDMTRLRAVRTTIRHRTEVDPFETLKDKAMSEGVRKSSSTYHKTTLWLEDLPGDETMRYRRCLRTGHG